MKIRKRDAFLATICYADVFAYPLTHSELVLWHLFDTEIIRRIPSSVTCSNIIDKTYYFLDGRKNIISTRQRRFVWSSEKWIVARRRAQILTSIPTVLFVGVTGGLSQNNADKKDDIDFFIVSARGTLWMTRFFVTVLLDIVGIRRKKHDTEFRDKICLNMFMDEDSLTLRKSEQDLFTAHEVLQMVPLWDRKDTYKKFLEANLWVKFFLPNAWNKKHTDKIIRYDAKRHRGYFSIQYISTIVFRIFEPIAQFLQLWYMRKWRTTEVISGGVLRVHPKDARQRIRMELRKRLEHFHIPLDNIFYSR